MKISESLYKRHRFPSEIIQYAVWLYHRFNMSHRDIEDLTVHATVYNLFNPGRHMVSADNYRLLRVRAFASWKCEPYLYTLNRIAF